MRLPAHWWKWVLLFSPTAVMLLATGFDVAFIPRAGRMLVGFDGAIVGFYLALPLCFVAAFFLTKPDPKPVVRAIYFMLMAVTVAAVNCPFTFVGCLLVMK